MEGEACSTSGMQTVVPFCQQRYECLDNNGWVAVYGEGFIGDFVNKLEKTSRATVYDNFHEGQDVAIISLRDDVFGRTGQVQATKQEPI